MASFVDLQAAAKKSLQDIQTITRNGKDLFRTQLQKKLCKEILDSEFTVSSLKTRDSQNLLNNHVKSMIQSWSLSVAQLSEEIDRRVQKL
jgi:N-terminal acetyltransferase B complex non-catalytic subunit